MRAMKAQSTKPRFPANSGGSGDSTLHGRKLTITQVVWVTVSLLAVTIFVASLPLLYDVYQELRIYAPGDRDAVHAYLIQLGLSNDLFAAYFLAVDDSPAVAYFTVAAILFWRKSNEPMALFVGLLFVMIGATFWGASHVVGAIHPLLEWLSSFMEALSLGMLFLLFFLFPNGRFVPRWTRWPAGVLVTWTVSLALFPNAPFNIESWPFLPYALFLLGWLLIGVYAQIYRYLRVSSPVQRQQSKWAFFGFTAAIAGYIGWISIYTLLPLARPESQLLADIVGAAVTSAQLLIIPFAFGIAILRYHLWDIDLVINRTLVYGSLTAMLALVYVGGVTSTEALFRTLTSQERQPQLAIVVSTLVIAALFNPLRRSIQSFIDRSFYRRKYDARKTLETFSAQLRDETNLDALGDDLVGVVRETMQPAHVSLWLRPDTDSKSRQTSSTLIHRNS
jgi:hypothetical protein